MQDCSAPCDPRREVRAARSLWPVPSAGASPRRAAPPLHPRQRWRCPLCEPPGPKAVPCRRPAACSTSATGSAILRGWQRIPGQGGVEASVVPPICSHAVVPPLQRLLHSACCMLHSPERHAGTCRAQPPRMSYRAGLSPKPVHKSGRRRPFARYALWAWGPGEEAPARGFGAGAGPQESPRAASTRPCGQRHSPAQPNMV
jgi:hypothetical protein